MSLLTSIGTALWAAPSALVRGGKATVQMVAAAPAALASGSKRLAGATATVLKNTSVAAVSGGWNLTKTAASGLRNGTVKVLTAGTDAVIAQNVQNYSELIFRIHTVGTKIFNDMSEKMPRGQFNRNEFAARLEAYIQENPIKKPRDRDFILQFCKDLRDPTVIFDDFRELKWARLEKILPHFHMPVSQINRNEFADRLEEFTDLYSLKAPDREFILRFCEDLRNETVSFDKSKFSDMEKIEKILAPYFDQYRGYISSKTAEREQLEKLPGLTTTTTTKLTPEEMLEGIQTQVDLLKSNSIKFVLGKIILNMTLGMYTFEKLDLDKLEIDCLALGITPPKGKKTDIINFLIEVSNKAEIEGKTSDKLFKELLYRVIDNSGQNIFYRTQAKVRCWYMSSLVANLIGNLFDNLQATLVHFAKLPPEKQLEEITTLLINPVLKHLTALETPANGAALLNGNNPPPKTADQLLDQFIEAFLEQFLDRKYQPFTRSARASCMELAYRSTGLTHVGFMTLATLFWVAGKILSPIQWALNETIHYILKKIIVSLCPTLSNSTKDTLEIGKEHPWHTVKNSLLTMLQQIRLTGLLPRTEDPTYQPPKKLPTEVKEKLTATLDKLFKILAIPEENRTPAENKSVVSTLYSALKLIVRNMGVQDAGKAEEDLREFLSNDGSGLTTFLQKNMHGKGLSWLKDIIKNSVTELTLDLVAQDGFINGILLTSLTNTNLNGFQPSNVYVPETEQERLEMEQERIASEQDLIALEKERVELEMEPDEFEKKRVALEKKYDDLEKKRVEAKKKRVDQDLHKELGHLGGTILQAVNNATRTDHKYPTYANIYINTLKQEVQTLQQALKQIHQNPDISFGDSALKICGRFTESLENLRKEMTENLDAPTKALLTPHLQAALDQVFALPHYLAQKEIEKKRAQVEAKFDQMYRYMEAPLEYIDEIEEIFNALRALNPSFLDVEATIKDFNKQFDIYMTRVRTAKKEDPIFVRPLQTWVALNKYRANQSAKKQIEDFRPSETELNSELDKLHAWASGLKFMKIKTKPTAADAGFSQLYALPIVQAATSAGIQSYGRNLFTFIGDEKNLAGIAQRTMDAYLIKPAMMPKKTRVEFGVFSAFPWRTSVKIKPLTEKEKTELAAAQWVVF